MEQNFRGFVGQLAYVSEEEVEKTLRAEKDKVKLKYVYLDNESARKLLPKDTKPEEQGKKLDEKIESLTKEILPSLGKADQKVNGLLRDTKVTVKTSDWVSAQASVIPGVGSIRSIQDEIATLKKGDPARKFSLMGGTFYAMVIDQGAFDPSKVTAKEKSETLSKLEGQRQGEILSEFIKASMKKASISQNDKVVKGNRGTSTPVTPQDN